MKIYAIRDRLIDYYMTPFAAPSEKDVLASLAQTINTGDLNSAIAQAPHHFELWQLGLVTEDGHLTPQRQFLADCSSLIRADIRKDAGDERRGSESQETHRGEQEPARGTNGRQNASDRVPEEPAPAKARPRA